MLSTFPKQIFSQAVPNRPRVSQKKSSFSVLAKYTYCPHVNLRLALQLFTGHIVKPGGLPGRAKWNQVIINFILQIATNKTSA